MKLIPLILLAVISTTHAQTMLKCTVLDSTTKAPLAFVNVGIPNKGVGTVTNELGVFTLTIPDSLKTEKLKISTIGYKCKTVGTSALAASPIIFMASQAFNLKQVTILPHKIKQTVLGNKTTSQTMVVTSSGKSLGWEIATFLNIKHKQTYLKTLKISMVKNPYVNAKYRINVYAKDANGNIGDNILKKQIIGMFPTTSSVMDIDLSKYNLYVDNDVFVAVEQISMYESGKNQITFSVKMLDKIYFRESSQGKWSHIPVGAGMWVEAEY
jgi:hypothetical protein